MTVENLKPSWHLDQTVALIIGRVFTCNNPLRYSSDPGAAIEIAAWMRENGSSVVINWGEDDDAWEVSWITGGKRYSAFHSKLEVALCSCLVGADKAIREETAKRAA